MPRNASDRSKNAAPTSAIGERRARRRVQHGRDERLGEVLQAAAKVFRTLGYEAATLDDVGRELNIDRATLYYYVSSKPDLLALVIKEPLEKLISEAKSRAAEQETASEKIRVILQTQIRAIAETYTGLDLAYEQANLQRYGEHGQALRKRGIEYTRFIQTVIDEGKQSGEFRQDLDSRVVTMALAGMMNWVHRWYDGTPGHAEIAHTFAEIAINGLSEARKRPAR